MSAGRRFPRWSVSLLLVPLLGLLGLTTSVCNRSGRPNILLVSIDTLRADALGAAGSARARTPHLDRLIRSGAAVRECVCQAPLTLPSFASILTGRLPCQHGVRNNGTYALPEEETTLAELLAAAGYRTAAFIGAYPVHSSFGLAQGFEEYDDHFLSVGESAAWRGHFNERPGLEVTRAAAAWLGEQGRRQPFFVWLHYYDPHAPFAPPPPHDRLAEGDLYAGEVAYVDACVGRLLTELARLGLADRTLVCLVADHGEGLGAHGEESHGTFLYDTTVLVPLALSFPGRLPAGTLVDGQVETVDILPTLLELAGLEAPSDLAGRSLAAALTGAAAPPREPARIESLQGTLDFGWHPLAAVRRPDLKAILGAEPEIYDLAADPAEGNPSADPGALAPPDRRALETLARQVFAGLEQGAAPAGREASPEEIERLQSLGYLHGGGGAPGAIGDLAALPDPRKMHGPVMAQLEQASQLSARGAHAGAIEIYERILAVDPTNPTAHERRGHALFLAGRPADAIEAYRRALELAPANGRLWINLANVYQETGRLEDARAAAREGTRLQPGLALAWSNLGALSALLGDEDEAIASYERALELDPDQIEVLSRLIDLHRRRPTPDQARIEAHQRELDRLEGYPT